MRHRPLYIVLVVAAILLAVYLLAPQARAQVEEPDLGPCPPCADYTREQLLAHVEWTATVLVPSLQDANALLRDDLTLLQRLATEDGRLAAVEDLQTEIGLLRGALDAAQGDMIALESARQEAEQAATTAQAALADALNNLMAAEAARSAAEADAALARSAVAAERAEVVRLQAREAHFVAELDDAEARIATAYAISGAAAPTTLEVALRRLRQVNLYLAP